MTVRAVVFDWGGVIQRTTSQASRHAIDHELGLAPGSVESAVFDSELWRLASIGHCSADRAWTGICTSLGIDEQNVDAFCARFFADDYVDGDLIRLILRLRDAGILVGLLSNAPPGYGSLCSPRSRWGRQGLFDKQVFSYQVGALKPDARMYHAILDALRIRPRDAIFVDDARINVLAARAIGMAAHWFQDVPRLSSALADHGLASSAIDGGPTL